MKKIYFIISLLIGFSAFAQNDTLVYKKRVLEATEVDYLLSYYTQDGLHSSVGGGIGSEELTDLASNIVVSMPLNDDDVLTIDAGFSAYTSASSSNINPFQKTGASSYVSGTNLRDGGDDDDGLQGGLAYGTPWQASSGASASDVLASLVVNYAHSSDDRNFTWNADVSFSNEYDYTSVGFGGGLSKLFNDKNSEISLKANAYLDQWRPIYPTELSEYGKYGNDFQNNGYFNNVRVIDETGAAAFDYLPSNFTVLDQVNRNSYSTSIGFSQVITPKLQASVFFDLLFQNGLLSTPYHRVYFKDKANYYIGGAEYINNYTDASNVGVYQLADDIERLPNNRFKLPIGVRLNYYLSERIILRTYYRYYWDDWGLSGHTASIEIPIKISSAFTVYPMYRFYTQNQSTYFAPFETHVSTEQYYTSDYDLSSFDSNQFGFGATYTDIFTSFSIWKFGLKNVDFRFNQYNRTDGLKASIGSLAFKFVFN